MEDQTGKKLTTGDINHWQTGEINSEGNPAFPYFRIGGRAPVASGEDVAWNVSQLFNGKVEEIVIYNKVIYPINPENKEFTLYKPMKEFSVAATAVGKPITAKLIIKDYHNIRGTTPQEVASSSVITISKGGLGLKTN